jgi:hypothetical protein
MLATKGFAPPLKYIVFGTQESSPDNELQQQILRLVAEGLQVLEHASLIRAQANQGRDFDYALTRRGRTALDRGEVEAILATTTA